ncbi:hypothetical protein GDI3019 [Gluconacetobacter diazotrophicus PA1 5]|uniref:Uncharacterized protein n=1 Tax=Gluconacetobacter diazotrophicus (strain ATCC 49037 / DSM 5601 / CCUG 37298 / CIP 103539 / LMG 7603 / PAl5) TaxID=272568 RepID=A9HRQ7_GLUDA|nr:hypothetical protein GDI3019 [Gluconacetobacter diazotrophicus PA1 5]
MWGGVLIGISTKMGASGQDFGAAEELPVDTAAEAAAAEAAPAA